MRTAAAPLLLLPLLGCHAMPASFNHPLAGAQAPALAKIADEPAQVGIPTTNATAVKVTIIDFWASWCPGCQTSIPALEALYRERRGEGLRVVGVSVDEHPEHARAMAASLGASFPIVFDDGNYASSYRVAQVPITFVVDANGTVRWVGREPAEVRDAALAVLAE
jgi:cytochrome c biogenesis protein CcmG, thiol:disulfide interchange protein DsbE